MQPLLEATQREVGGGNKTFQVHLQKTELEKRYSTQRGKQVWEEVSGMSNRVLEVSGVLNHWKSMCSHLFILSHYLHMFLSHDRASWFWSRKESERWFSSKCKCSLFSRPILNYLSSAHLFFQWILFLNHGAELMKFLE